MEKKVLLFLVSILLINFISAAYDCSGTVSTDESFIGVGQIEVINGAKLVLVDSSVGKAAELLIDTKELTLTSDVNSTNVTLASGFHEINLTRIIGTSVSMKIDNDIEGDLEYRVVGAIGNLSFYISTLSGSYPGGEGEVEFFIGKKYLFLYENNPESVEKIGSTEHLFIVSSSDSSGAIIEVQKCSGGDFVEIEDPVEEDPEEFNVDLSPLQNDSDQNESPIDDISSDEIIDSENLPDENLSQKLYIVVIVIVIMLVVLIGVFILFRVYKKKKGLTSPKEVVNVEPKQ